MEIYENALVKDVHHKVSMLNTLNTIPFNQLNNNETISPQSTDIRSSTPKAF